jgi:hypothetical protein
LPANIRLGRKLAYCNRELTILKKFYYPGLRLICSKGFLYLVIGKSVSRSREGRFDQRLFFCNFSLFKLATPGYETLKNSVQNCLSLSLSLTRSFFDTLFRIHAHTLSGSFSFTRSFFLCLIFLSFSCRVFINVSYTIFLCFTHTISFY